MLDWEIFLMMKAWTGGMSLSRMPFPRLEDIMLMSALGEEIKGAAEIRATRPHFLVQALDLLQKRKIALF